jgi:ABC-2 type transport system ATP-binding protein
MASLLTTPTAAPGEEGGARPTVRLRGVVARRGTTPVLTIDALDLESGTVAAVVGPNGSGKSTLLHVISGLLPADGEVRVLGARPGEARRRVAYVLQATAVDPYLPVTVREVVAMGRYPLGGRLARAGAAARRADRAAVDAAIERLELGDLTRRYLGELSGGERQRALVAQGLAQEGEVLLLDEPVSGMDPVNRRRVIDLVKRLGREGKTVLVSSHILHEVEAMTRRVLLIHNGRILAEGDVREIRDLMDEHPHTVSIRARSPRRLAAAVVGAPHLLSLSFGPEGEWLTVQTAKPDEFYGALPEAAIEAGVSEMYSPDEDLESVFKYLVAR